VSKLINSPKRINVKINLSFITFESSFFVLHFSQVTIFFCKTIWRVHDPSIIPEIVDIVGALSTSESVFTRHAWNATFVYAHLSCIVDDGMRILCVWYIKRLIRKLIWLFAKTCKIMMVYYLDGTLFRDFYTGQYFFIKCIIW